MRDIKESDWKKFRKLQPLALERYCQRVLSELEAISSDDSQSFHERYLAVFKLVEARDKSLARLFDNPSRSRALLQLAGIYGQGLLTDEEFMEFSQGIRNEIELIVGARNA